MPAGLTSELVTPRCCRVQFVNAHVLRGAAGGSSFGTVGSSPFRVAEQRAELRPGHTGSLPRREGSEVAAGLQGNLHWMPGSCPCFNFAFLKCWPKETKLLTTLLVICQNSPES